MSKEITFEDFMVTYHGLLTDMFEDDSPIIPGTILREEALDPDGATNKLVDFNDKYPAYAERLIDSKEWVTLCKSFAKYNVKAA